MNNIKSIIEDRLEALQAIIDDQPKAPHSPTEEESVEDDSIPFSTLPPMPTSTSILDDLLAEFAPEKEMIVTEGTEAEWFAHLYEVGIEPGDVTEETMNEIKAMHTTVIENPETKALRVLTEQLIENQYFQTAPEYYHLIRPMTAVLVKVCKELYPTLFSLVGVQPMSAATGKLYRLEYSYADISPEVEESHGRRMHLNVVTSVVEAWTGKLSQSFTKLSDFPNEEWTNAVALNIAEEVIAQTLSTLHLLGRRDGDNNFHQGIVVKPESAMQFGCNIRQLCSHIAQRTRRGAGNFVILSQHAFNVLTSDEKCGFKAEDQYGDLLCYMGKMNDSIKVFVNLDTLSDTVLVGYKGSSEVDTGYIYAPFVQIALQEVTHPVSQEKLLACNQRYGDKCFESTDGLTNSSNYYEVMEVDLSHLAIIRKD